MTDRVDDASLLHRAEALAAELRAHGRTMATAESCTGGWIAKVCTDLAGSSDWFDRGLVTYSNRAKAEALGVRAATIDRYGAVSEMVVAEMARGARSAAHVDYAVAVSGIAGPGGGRPDKPVGTVCFGWVGPDDEPETETVRFDGDRDAVRRRTVAYALDGLLERVSTRS
ncbi:nicotinamide-nucleotide amidase [Wenzhouxiangella sp. XN79A]|uniref:nicotinamide-nucleotide amidase n=1 Tax=Wenzhouxiangella sp. XN79A TaxID=2724193 RepID=UPI00144A9212|nr:nicotinamide-nucleotide amidase [Wenzhouxiangella sp. XN79A]NKI35496.1 nicotinamide-nucleotide amidase [Wenzhouxiangella sp. XN79A]